MTPVLIPILNGRILTRNCIRSVLAQDVPTEVWVLDNGSTDGSAEMLRAWPDPRVHYIAAHKPSVAASWNFGLRFLFQEHESVLVLNNDTLLRSDAVRLLLADAVDQSASFVTCVSRNDQECLTEALPPREEWNRRARPDFSCFMISAGCYRNTGPFDENCIPAFYEDNLYHVAMHRSGIRAYCIDVPFYHVGSATIKDADKAMRERISNAAAKNKEYFKSLMGCYPATPEYDALFEEQWFGMNAGVTTKA